MSMKLLEGLVKLGKEACCFMPEESVVSIPAGCESKIRYYKKTKNINVFSAEIKELTKRVLDETPDIVWCIEDSVVSLQLVINIGSRAKTCMICHDPKPHPEYHKGIKRYFHDLYENMLKYRAYQRVFRVILMSKEMKQMYEGLHPEYRDKTELVLLGCTVPECEPRIPDELKEDQEALENDSYYLFFGRVEKYKGIDMLIEIEKDLPRKLIIAGKGDYFDKYTDQVGYNLQNTILINRYIKDEEMIYLLKHCHAVILPYIEASQSGVLPAAYSFTKPVIVSSVRGLTQFVEDGETGYICSKAEDYIEAAEKLEDPENYAQRCRDVDKYYAAVLDWMSILTEFCEKYGL